MKAEPAPPPSPDGVPGSPAGNGTVEGRERPMARTYVAVLAVELLVLVGLWAFSRHFSP